MDRGKEVLANALNELIAQADRTDAGAWVTADSFKAEVIRVAKEALAEADTPVVEPVDCIVPMSEPVLCLLRSLLDAQVQLLYQRNKIGVKMELEQLRQACEALRMDWEETVRINAKDYEIRRMAKLTGNPDGY